MAKKEFKNRLKKAFNNYDYLKVQNLRELSELGFTLEFSKKHNKLVFQDGNRIYKFSIACTPSDRKKAGLNLVNEIVNRIYAV